VKVVLLDPEEVLPLSKALQFFGPNEEDMENRTSILSNFHSESSLKEKWNRQILGLHEVILFMVTQGAHDHTVTADSFLGFKNSVHNLPSILKNPDLRNTKALFKGKPAFIIGAGPSISPQLEWLRQYQDRALFVAADTMLRPLSKYGMEPQVIASLERSPNVADLLDMDNPHPRTLLVGCSVLDPNCFLKYQGPQSSYFTYNNSNLFFPFPRSRFRTGEQHARCRPCRGPFPVRRRLRGRAGFRQGLQRPVSRPAS